MKMYQVNQYGCHKTVYTTSLGRKVKDHGYYTKLKPYELLTESQFERCCLSGKVNRKHFNVVNVEKSKIIKSTNGSSYIYKK